ncbi:PEPxxWA-CTERM sorting domain-containing protein [Sphingomonas sp. RS2018]
MNKIMFGAAIAATLAAAPAAAQTTLYSNNLDGAQTAAAGVTAGITANGATLANDNVTAGGLSQNYLRNDTAGLTTLTFNGLSGYTNINAGFALALIDSWDSDNGSPAPDYLDIFVNGAQVLQLTAANTSGNATRLGGGTQTAFGSYLYNGAFNDRIVDMSTATALQNLSAINGTLTLGIRASGAGFQYGNDESWGIDNIRLSGTAVNSAVPEPATWAMMMLGFGGMGYAVRRKPRVAARIRFA